MVDQIFDVHADDAVDKVIVIGDVDLAQDLTEQTVVQLAIGRVGCAALGFCVCSESRHRSETERQYQSQHQAQCLAHFFHGILPPLSSKLTYMERCRQNVGHRRPHPIGAEPGAFFYHEI